jgi:excisionase family DNA binding protein
MNTNTRGSDAAAVAATKTLEPQFDRKTYTVEEAADLVGIGRSLAYELAQEGTLPGVRRLGRRYVVSRAVLDAWLESPQPCASVQ